MAMQVHAELERPRGNWGSVSPGEVGVVTKLYDDDYRVKVDFPSQEEWKGYRVEMEVTLTPTMLLFSIPHTYFNPILSLALSLLSILRSPRIILRKQTAWRLSISATQ